MYTFLVHLLDTDYDINRLVVCIEKKQLADLMLNIDEKHKILKIEVLNSEFETDYKNLLTVIYKGER